jgi:hypothetical protein
MKKVRIMMWSVLCGLASTVFAAQDGEVENRGWEASLSYSDQFKFGLGISSTLTFSRNINEIKES